MAQIQRVVLSFLEGQVTSRLSWRQVLKDISKYVESAPGEKASCPEDFIPKLGTLTEFIIEGLEPGILSYKEGLFLNEAAEEHFQEMWQQAKPELGIFFNGIKSCYGDILESQEDGWADSLGGYKNNLSGLTQSLDRVIRSLTHF